MTFPRPIEVQLNDGLTFKIQYEENYDLAGDMRDFTAGTILTTNNRYWTGDEVIGRDIEEYEVDDFLKKIVDDGGVVLPIKMYVHSGVTVWHSDLESRIADRWDSGVVGWSYMTAEKIQSEYKAVNDETRAKAKKLLDWELKDVDALLQGEVYWGGIFDEDDCIVESTGGYYNYETLEDMAESMLECFAEDYHDEIMEKIRNNEFDDI